MGRTRGVRASAVIAVDPATVYAEISDPSRTGRWSPENLGADADGPLAVGDTFVGHNRRGAYRWSTRCRVTTADSGRTFAFRVEAIGLRTPRLRAPIATWTYDLDAVDGATRVTETWTDERPWPDGVARVFDKIATGTTFARFNQRNIERSLAALKRTLEA